MNRSAAFTLIELLAATALAALLMVTVLTVVGSLDHPRRMMVAGTAHETWPSTLAQLVRDDLEHVRHYAIEPNGLVLETLVHLDPMTLDAHHRPVRVHYRHDPETGSLLRGQTDLLDRTNRRSNQALVATGVRAWQVREMVRDAEEDQLIVNEYGPTEGTAVGLRIQARIGKPQVTQIDVTVLLP